ncbi:MULTISPECIES: Rieske (2Fe-2S) protein [Citricoccus]|uniref:Rieske (2Fe-2S) protein n=1 Tax=Citricoccus TaxID=169133 RepID=UPI000305B018|nr:Rieske (2Fe-2S) protein [Citricoccus sp. CH26A]
MKVLDELMGRVERWKALDRVGRPAAAVVGRAVSPRPVRNLLSGTALGHPAHPLLTDLPIGAWSMATLLDLVGGRASEPAADLLVAAGMASAVPTAATGLNDWSDTQGAARRVGQVHAASVNIGLALYTASFVSRRRGARTAGKLLGLAGLGAVMAGGYLGGHLSYALGVNVNRTAWRKGPRDWADVLDAAELTPGAHRVVQAGPVSVLLVRDAEGITALDSVCSHMGGPLEEGTIADGCVTCPWHGSTFRLEDGGIVRGPASVPQPAYEARVRDGRVQVRARP